MQNKYDNKNTFEMFNQTWFVHPLFKAWPCSEDGQILYLRKKILKPKMTDLGMVFYVNFSGSFELYLVQNFVYEALNDIEEIDSTVVHKNGDLSNNNIKNLELAK